MFESVDVEIVHNRNNDLHFFATNSCHNNDSQETQTNENIVPLFNWIELHFE